MGKFVLYSLLLLFGIAVTAQKSNTEVTALVVDQESGQPMPYVTVLAKSVQDDQTLEGTITNEIGVFNFKAPDTSFYVELSFIGYDTQTISDINVKDGNLDLGTIKLKATDQQLGEVTLRGEVSKTVFKLDKRVFNVGKDIASTGASALEVLNNVPSVNVDIEGQVSLRGSAGVQILINGKPSVLADDSNNALGTITANMIESIEVITNPSAKYEASGTSGILNIILKKDEKEGWNGSVSVNTGVPDNHSTGLSLNRRTEKFNLFSQFGIGYRSLPEDLEAVNRDEINNEEVRSVGEAFRDETFFNITLGTDYHINDKNVLTLSGSFAYEEEQQPSDILFSQSLNGVENARWLRRETTDASNPKWQYELNYKSQFDDREEHVLLLSAQGTFFGKDQSSLFTIEPQAGNVTEDDQTTATNFQQAKYTFRADYTNPISDAITLETGLHYVITDVGNEYTVSDLVNNAFVVNTGLTNDFDYDQNVFGVYGLAAYDLDKWGFKAGLRLENTDLNTLLVTTNESNDQNFSNFFPSFHSSLKISEKLSLQAGYSKRIQRPRLWDLNPFFNIRNNFNVRRGNPDLKPEFTDSYELTAIYNIGKASFSSSVYHLYTTDVIERITNFEGNTAITMPENIGTNSSIGVETNFKYKPLKWLSFSGDLNYGYFSRTGNNNGTSFDFTGNQFNAKLGSKTGLPSDIDLEINGRYRSDIPTVQGNRKGFAFMDVGARKKFAKGKLVLNVGLRDVFRSRIQDVSVASTGFSSNETRTRGRFFTFGASYAFGKGEAISYSGRRR